METHKNIVKEEKEKEEIAKKNKLMLKELNHSFKTTAATLRHAL